MHRLLAIILLFVTVVCVAQTENRQIETITLPSKYIDPAGKVMVVTPAGYNDAQNFGRHYPVVYLLHGYGDDYECWPKRTQPALDSLATNWNMIFVCPDGRNSWYFDSRTDPKKQMESYITRELVPYIDANYRTIPDPAHRAITGLSMGGHGALRLAILHSDIWGNAGSTSGGVDLIPFPGNWEISKALGPYEDNKELWEKSTVISLASTLQPGQLNIIFDCGTEDFFAEVNENLHKELLKHKIPHDYISRPGNHSHPYWRNAILFQLQFFNEKFTK
ncbi:MAG: esterase family protein [Muribaculaceae bacterium]|nr:esterase family protein [Muribaculaceae bacterium]